MGVCMYTCFLTASVRDGEIGANGKIDKGRWVGACMRKYLFLSASVSESG